MKMGDKQDISQHRLLTIQEVADILHVSRMTIWRLTKQGLLPKLNIARGRYKLSDVLAYIEKRYS